MKYIIGTRGSRLSMTQTQLVKAQLEAANTDAEFEIKTITTKGDTDTRPLFTIDQKGIFEKEIDKQVSDKTISFAVHSMKDVPSDLAKDLVLACVPPRESTDDVLITRNGVSIESLDPNSTVGTSSLRRAVEALQIRKDLNIIPVRGNIETRIRKVESGEIDAIILARAGISRLKLDTRFHTLDPDIFLPAPGQGALGLVAHAHDNNTITMLQKIESSDSRSEIDAERALSAMIESGCKFPVGARAKCNGDTLDIHAVAFSIDGKTRIDTAQTGLRVDAVDIGKAAAHKLYQKGVGQLALNWREKVAEWNAK